MTAENLQNLLAHPYRIAESELEALEELVTQYPYFQLGHLLIAKYAQDQESMLAPQKTRRAAVYAYDRRLLRKLMNTFPPKEQQAGKISPEDLAQELKNTKSFFDLLPPIELDDFSEGYVPQAEKSTVKELLKEPIETLWDNQLSENDAIELFNAGKIEEAKQLYEALMKQNPTQIQDYQNRWNILSGNLPKEEPEEQLPIANIVAETLPETTKESEQKIVEALPETQKESEKQEVTENIDAFFEDITVPEGQPDYLHYNEGIALGLYYDGKEKEAIEMYKKLMEFYPEKKEYYQEQVIMLVGKRAYMASFEPKVQVPVIETAPKEEVISSPTESVGVPTLDIESSMEEAITLEALESEFTKPHADIPLEIVETQEESTDGNIHEFFEDIETHEKIIPTVEQPKNEYFTEEELPFFDSIEHLELSENVPVDLPPLEIPIDLPNTEIVFANEEAIFLTESQAIAYFNQGKLELAISTYDQLIRQNPIKTSYYESQIRVLRETMREALRPPKKVVAEIRPIENEEVSEDLAIRLFTQDKTAEAIAVYEKLIEKNPNKRMHYLRQIEVLKS
jgi:tetratricopeptide (TPR) repeat protein